MSTASRPKKLLEQVDDAIRLMHYSPRTAETYAHWIKRFILFHDKRHPNEMGAAEVQAFLTYLAIDQNVAASTQNQALSALLFLYRYVLHQPLNMTVDAVRARKPEHLPTVLSKDEVRRILDKMSGVQKLMAQLLYGTGMRVSECVQLRVKDIDFDQHDILVRDAKGMKDRLTMLPDSLVAPLHEHLARVRLVHERDLATGYGAAPLPFALERKYPNAEREWAWQFAFPSTRLAPPSLVRRAHRGGRAACERCARRRGGGAVQVAGLRRHDVQ